MPSRCPLVRQVGPSDCGLACLSMLAAAHGRRVNRSELQWRFGSSHGLTLQALMRAADSLGFQLRACRLEPSELEALRLPAILHWDLSHYVVLERVNRKRCIVVDPALGRLSLPLTEMHRRFTGVALEAWPGDQFRDCKGSDGLRLVELLSAFGSARGPLLQLAGLAIVIECLGMSVPLVSHFLIDEVLRSGDGQLLLMTLIALGMVGLPGICLGYLRAGLAAGLEARLKLNFAGNAMSHLLSLPLEFFQGRSIGDLLSRLASIGPVQQFITVGLSSMLVQLASLSVSLIVMLFYSPSLTFVSAAGLCLRSLPGWLVLPRWRALGEQQLIAQADEHSRAVENLESILSLKSSGLEQNRWSVWHADLVRTTDVELKLSLFSRTLSALGAAGALIEQVVFMGLAGWFVMQNQLTLGGFFALSMVRSRFGSALSAIFSIVSDAWLLGLHADRLADVLLAEPESKGSGCSVKGRLQVRGLEWSWSESERPLFTDLHLDIDPGELVVIAGPNGSGKSTLLMLLAGLARPVRGSIEVDGLALSSIDPRQYRWRVGVLLQSELLFRGSVAENISGFDPWPDSKRVRRAASLAGIHDELSRLPLAYETATGPGGEGFSGGQIRRIQLARCLYRDPKLLLLDEPDAGLDRENRAALAETLANLGRTVVCVAHDPSIRCRAHRIIEMPGGWQTTVEACTLGAGIATRDSRRGQTDSHTGDFAGSPLDPRRSGGGGRSGAGGSG